METLWLPGPAAYLRYLDRPGADPPLVFLHCLGGALTGYVQTACQQELAGRRAILLDLLGYGCSDRPQRFGYTLAEQAGTVATLLDHLGIARAVIVGHSMGGSVAIGLAAQHPELVTNLIVAEPPLELREESASRMIAAQEETSFVGEGFVAFLASLRAAAAGDTTLATFLGMFQIAAPHAVHRTAVNMMAATPTLFDHLARFGGPRTYIWGERTLAEEPRAAQLIARLEAAGVNCVAVPGAGHHPNLDNPAGLAGAIAAALESPAPLAYRSAK